MYRTPEVLNIPMSESDNPADKRHAPPVSSTNPITGKPETFGNRKMRF